MNPRSPALRLPALRPTARLALAALFAAGLPGLLGAAPQAKAKGAAAPAPAPPAPAKTPGSTAPAGVPPFEVAENAKGGTWFGRFGLTNCSWVDMGDGVAVIDTGASVGDARNLVAQIGEKCAGKPIRWVVLTHMHADSNSGLPALLGPDVTLFVHSRNAETAAASIGSLVKGGRRPTVVGVSEKAVLATATRRLEVLAASGAAHTGSDLVAFLPDLGTAWVGDLVTPGRCPMTSDPQCDPSGWLALLERIGALHPSMIVPTRGDASLDPTSDIKASAEYLRRLQAVTAEFKAKGYPEARVSGELSTIKLGDYCPQQLDAINVLSIYRRLGADGKLAPEPQPAVTGKAPSK